jgi:hypothetical protein
MAKVRYYPAIFGEPGKRVSIDGVVVDVRIKL